MIDDCTICSNPESATWRERYEHGCNFPGEITRCVWCGEPHLVGEGPKDSFATATWCAGCMEKHQAANPDCEWFRGFVPIEDTLPGGLMDGVWENSGLALGDEQ